MPAINNLLLSQTFAHVEKCLPFAILWRNAQNYVLLSYHLETFIVLIIFFSKSKVSGANLCDKNPTQTNIRCCY